MYLDEYQKITIDNFMGLWNRGSLDDVPMDHSCGLQNIAFAKKKECQTRMGASVSKSGLSYNVIRQFLATFNNNTLIPLWCDGAGHIYRGDTNTVLLSVTNMIDFDALNMFNKCIIAPILSSFSGTNYLYIWDGTNAPRFLGGAGPTSSFSAANSGTGNVVAGVHQFAVSFITATGYTTTPGPLISGVFTPVVLTTPGGEEVSLTGIPTGPTGTVGRQLFATQAGLDVFYYVATINDNTTTSYTLNFFDTDLVLSADSLFDLQPFILSGVGYGGVGLIKYNNRMLVIGPTADKVLTSNGGDCESFNTVTGYISVPSEFDGNFSRTGAALFGVLYISKAVGIYSCQDNGYEPNDPNYPWVVNSIDGVCGAYHHTIGTVTGSQPGLSFNSTLLLGNRDGIFLFNGNVQRPELTWKIRAVWAQLTVGYEALIRIAIDAFSDLFYVLLPINGSTTPNLLLIGDYSLGLDNQNIRWSIYTFPWVVNDIVMSAYDDGTGGNGYYLRMGSNNAIYRLDGSTLTDNGTAINNYYQTATLAPSPGAVNIFRFLRYRINGAANSNLLTTLYDEAGANAVTTPNLTLSSPSTASKDLGLQINFTNERCIVQFGTDATTDSFKISRLDVFAKARFPTRPNG
jgi:hypothetical protein